MKIVTSPRMMQRLALDWRASGEKLVLVPTMGALHEGHLSLVRRARNLGDRVVVSIYVNPRQFGPREDFSRYPRPAARDRALCRTSGVDVVFSPRDLYLPDDSTVVAEKALSAGRCGRSRPGHFDGVTTVVAKLFLIVQPDLAVFGQKDAQQCEVIERMVRDLWFPIRVVRVPTHRDGRGLAMSSRNAYLSREAYEQALAFPRLLRQAARGALSAGAAERAGVRLLSRSPGLRVDYVEWSGGRLCAAVFCGGTRLIDNVSCPIKARGAS
ncbi:MAG: pantoate--beta-alanine ligase [Candidatus Methylacidiphilales bacterium]|nr:pantoate--beta-alanine ligase [Candidatus Methylacidiphilales bacterium]